MAEERIVVVDLKKQCAECRQDCEEYDGFNADCDQCPFAEKSIKRTEAIERMAKAMWNRNQKQIARTNKEFVIALWETIERPSPNTQLFLEEAKVALDALISLPQNTSK